MHIHGFNSTVLVFYVDVSNSEIHEFCTRFHLTLALFWLKGLRLKATESPPLLELCVCSARSVHDRSGPLATQLLLRLLPCAPPAKRTLLGRGRCGRSFVEGADGRLSARRAAVQQNKNKKNKKKQTTEA